MGSWASGDLGQIRPEVAAQLDRMLSHWVPIFGVRRPPWHEGLVPLQMLYADEQGNSFALVDGQILVQYRCGPLSHAALDACEKECIPALKAVGGPTGALVVASVDQAGVTSESIRERLRAIVAGYLDHPGAHMAAVVLGTSIEASAMRSIGRMLVMGRRNLRHHPTVADGCHWLADQVPVDKIALMAGYHHLVGLHQAHGTPP